MARSSSSYRRAGVDTEAGQRFVKAIAPLAAASARAGAKGELGGFGGSFDLAALNMRDPVLIASADGAGTKISLAIAANQPENIGRDVVAMCVNDLAAQGAEPLFFLDYIAGGKIDIELARGIVRGIVEACREAGCALIGGETAEMPGIYHKGEHDLAGFAVGAAERDKLLPRADTQTGDVILALASNGVHANGFSLIRQILQDNTLDISAPFPPAPDKSLAQILLTPTRLYVRPLLALLGSELGGAVKGLAHITGGGLPENLPRAWGSGEEFAAELDMADFPCPPVFGWLAGASGLAAEELVHIFNCGVGMAVIAAAGQAKAIEAFLRQQGEEVRVLGRIIPRAGGSEAVCFRGLSLQG